MKKLFIKKILPISIISLFFVQALYVTIIEPTITSATAGVSDTDTVVVNLNVDAGIAITGGTDPVEMLPNIGVTQMKSVGSSLWNVKTNNSGGYNLTVHSQAAPALVKAALPADNFADYTPTTTTTPETWSMPASVKEFGFSVYGTHALAAFYTTMPTDCGNPADGSRNSNAKFRGFAGSATEIEIARYATGPTTPTGIDTNICFAAEQGADVYATSGMYTTTITATATTL